MVPLCFVSGYIACQIKRLHKYLSFCCGLIFPPGILDPSSLTAAVCLYPCVHHRNPDACYLHIIRHVDTDTPILPGDLVNDRRVELVGEGEVVGVCFSGQGRGDMTR